MILANDPKYEEAEIMKTEWSFGYTGELDGSTHAKEKIEHLWIVTKWLTLLIPE